MVSMHIDSAPSGRNVQALPSFGRVPERSEGGWVDLQVHVDFAAQKIISRAHENLESIPMAACRTTPQSAPRTAPQPWGA